MREIALHLLDLAENSAAAQAKQISIQILEDLEADRLHLRIQDDGKGMTPQMVQQVTDPFVTSRTTRKAGLGIPLLKAAAQACNGDLRIQSQVGKGTVIEVDFQHTHIDRMPLGDLSETLLSLIVAHPEVNWLLDYRVIGADQKTSAEFSFDDKSIKEILDGVSLCEPEVLNYLRNVLKEGIQNVQALAANHYLPLQANWLHNPPE
jgi:anti-sigma regulatory factor (Ser/Thr protein kinase)